LATDEPSAFLLNLVQGLVTAFGAELGEWSALKASLKSFLPSMQKTHVLLSSATLSIDFNGDDGKLQNVGTCNFYC
jgi:hypothetical protein